MQSSPQPKRLTRSMTNDPHVIKCMEILEEPTPTFTINETKLPILLNRAVLLGKRCNISELEKIYSLLAQQIYKHRFSYDRAALVEVCYLISIVTIYLKFISLGRSPSYTFNQCFILMIKLIFHSGIVR